MNKIVLKGRKVVGGCGVCADPSSVHAKDAKGISHRLSLVKTGRAPQGMHPIELRRAFG